MLKSLAKKEFFILKIFLVIFVALSLIKFLDIADGPYQGSFFRIRYAPLIKILVFLEDFLQPLFFRLGIVLYVFLITMARNKREKLPYYYRNVKIFFFVSAVLFITSLLVPYLYITISTGQFYPLFR